MGTLAGPPGAGKRRETTDSRCSSLAFRSLYSVLLLALNSSYSTRLTYLSLNIYMGKVVPIKINGTYTGSNVRHWHFDCSPRLVHGPHGCALKMGRQNSARHGDIATADLSHLILRLLHSLETA